MSPRDWLTRPPIESDRHAWRRLFADYCAFYAQTADDEKLDRVWSWIRESGHVRAILLAPLADPDRVCGLAHLRPWVRPLRGQVAGHLDDLFIDPSSRGTGAFEALFGGISELAHREAWALVRWTTAEDNYRARAAYDRVARRTDWLTYDMLSETE